MLKLDLEFQNAKFEVLAGQLNHHSRKSQENVSALKAKQNDLAYSFCGTPVDLSNFTMRKECFQALKLLRNNKEIVITKVDKSSAVVILNKNDYAAKMDILNNISKFQVIVLPKIKTIPPPLKTEFNDAFLNSVTVILFQNQSTNKFGPQDHKDQECTTYRRPTKKTSHFVPFYP